MSSAPNRRRAIVILAAAAGVAPLAVRSAAEAIRWRGVMLGAPCAIELLHPEPERARAALEAALAEARRLEALFSLYQPDSALCELNRVGVLIAPNPDFIALLKEALAYTRLTGGAFDPTVQPLFTLMAQHFSKPGADPAGPPATELEAALAVIGASRVLVREDRVVLLPGTKITLNGIAQGYVTDRVASVLARGGLENALIDMGEIRAMGSRLDGTPWRVGLEAPDGAIWGQLQCKSRAVATSAGEGFIFDAAGRFNHIFDPRTGDNAHRFRAVAVEAPTATMADALSTASCLLSPEQIGEMVAAIPGVAAHLLDAKGDAHRLG